MLMSGFLLPGENLDATGGCNTMDATAGAAEGCDLLILL
jgi:hypothetical protein